MLTVVGRVKAEALIYFVSTNWGVIVTLVVEESVGDHAASVLDSGKVAWAETAIDLDEGFAVAARGVLVQSGVDVADLAFVEAGKAPVAVQKLAKKLAATSAWKTTGKGKVALFLDNTTASDKAEVAALQKLMKKAAGDYVTVTGGSIGKALKVLGYIKEAKDAAAKFADFLNGLGVDTVVCPNPAAFDALKNDYPAWGLKLKAQVFCTAGFLVAKKVRFAKKPGALYYLADDFMRNYCGCECPEKLLKALKAEEKMFGTNDEESYNCGEGAIVLDKLNPALVKELAKYVAERADDPKKDQIVTLGVYAKTQLVKYGKLNVKTLNEIAASCL